MPGGGGITDLRPGDELEKLNKSKKWTYLIQVVTLILVAISLYLSIFGSPFSATNQANDKDSLSNLAMKEKCLEVGSKAHDKIISEFETNRDGESSLLRPEFTYNKELDTCLYFSGSVGKDGFAQKWVQDSFTNEEILLSLTKDGEEVFGTLSPEEFDKRKIDLFEN